MAASTLTRATWTNDTGSAASPNGDGTLINNTRLQNDVYAPTDQLFAGAGAYTTFTFGGLVAAEGTGVHTFNGSTSGSHGIRLRNSSSTGGCFVGIGNNTAVDRLYLEMFGASFATSGRSIADGALIECLGAGGISYAANNAAGMHRWYSGGTTERMRLHASGGVSIGNTTDPGASRLSVSGQFLTGNGLNFGSSEDVSVSGTTDLSLPSGHTGNFVLRITTAASTPVIRTLTDAGGHVEGTMLLLVNQTATDIPLTHDFGNTSSLLCPNSADATLRKTGAVWLRYDGTTTRWRVLQP